MPKYGMNKSFHLMWIQGKIKCFHIISMKTDIFSKETGGRLKYVCFMLFPMGNYEVITFVTIIKNFYHGNIEKFLKKVNGR